MNRSLLVIVSVIVTIATLAVVPMMASADRYKCKRQYYVLVPQGIIEPGDCSDNVTFSSISSNFAMSG